MFTIPEAITKFERVNTGFCIYIFSIKLIMVFSLYNKEENNLRNFSSVTNPLLKFSEKRRPLPI